MAIELQPLELTYGFDDVSIIPGDVTINPEMVNISTEFCGIKLTVPILAAAMDGVVSPQFARQMRQLGGLAVLNLEGIHTRYADPEPIYEQIANASKEEAEPLLQRVYSEPIKDNLIADVVAKLSADGQQAVVSVTPVLAKKLAPIVQEAGAAVLVIQSTVTTARHKSHSPVGLRIDQLTKELKIPVVIGNTVSYEVSLELMEQGISGLLVGVGPGAACTSREVLGIGVPQISATMHCAAARDQYYKDTGRYVPIVTDGGIRTGGDINKSLVAGADAVMIGSPFAKTEEAPGRGYHWGMAAPHSTLPRGTRLTLGRQYSLKQLLFGPSDKTDGTENLSTAISTCMGVIGAEKLTDMHNATLIHAPSIKYEGKIYQRSGQGV